jgi:hypothetical protein
VHEHLGLVERRVDQELEAAVEHDLVFVGQFDAEVAADEPFREEVQFAAQQGAVIGRQRGGGGGELPFDQHVEHRRISRSASDRSAFSASR